MEKLKDTAIQHLWKDELENLQKVWNTHRDTILDEYKEDLETAMGAAKTTAKKRKITKK
jgi:hypothetical protein